MKKLKSERATSLLQEELPFEMQPSDRGGGEESSISSRGDSMWYLMVLRFNWTDQAHQLLEWTGWTASSIFIALSRCLIQYNNKSFSGGGGGNFVTLWMHPSMGRTQSSLKRI